MSTELHKQILPDYEDSIASLQITSSISQILLLQFLILSEQFVLKPVRLTNALSAVVSSDNFHGLQM